MASISCHLSEVLLTFLRAELDSPTERSRLLACLARLSIDESMLISDDDLDAYAIFQDYRGSEPIFTGLDWWALSWSRQMMSEVEIIQSVSTCRHNFQARYGTRKLNEVVDQLDDTTRAELRGVVQRLKVDTLEPPIVVRAPGSPQAVIVEGHNRMMGYLLYPDAVN